MVNSHIKLLDKIHLQKYIYLLTLFVAKEIEVSVFEKIFLNIRREDDYWMSGHLNEQASKILDTFFLDVDEYSPDILFDSNDNFNISEVELNKRAKETLEKLSALIK